MKSNQYSNYPTTESTAFLFLTLALIPSSGYFFDFNGKRFTKVIHVNENFYNFIS